MRTRTNIISRRPQWYRTGIYDVADPVLLSTIEFNQFEIFPSELTYTTNVTNRLRIGSDAMLLRVTSTTSPRYYNYKGSGSVDGVLIEQSNLNLSYLTDYLFEAVSLGKWLNVNTLIETGVSVDSPLEFGQSGDGNAARFSEVTAFTSVARSLTQASSYARTVTSGEYYTQSIYVNCGADFGEDLPLQYVQLSFLSSGFPANAYVNFSIALATPTVGTVGSGIAHYSIKQVQQTSWYRISATALCNTTSSVAGRFKLNMIPASNSTQDKTYFATVDVRSGYIWGAQYENSEGPSTYLLQDDSGNVTRLSDNIVLSGTNFSSVYNKSTQTSLIATFYFDQATAFGTGNRTILGIDSGTNKKLELYCVNGGTQVRLGWTGSQILSSASLVSGLNKVAITIDGSTNSVVKICLNGGTVVSGTSDVTKANQTWLNIGSKSTSSSSGFSDHLNNVFFQLKIYDGIFSDIKLKENTAL